MKRVPIYPIILTIATETPQNEKFTILYRTDSVLEPSMLPAYFSNFAEWYILKPDGVELSDYDWFVSVWDSYCKASEKNWQMLFKALLEEYNPLDNYDITEENDRTFIHTPDGETDTITTTTSAGTGAKQPKTEKFVATYESAEKPVEYSQTSGETVAEQQIQAKATYTDTDGYELHRHGNAGTMTTAEVVRQEAQLRKSELAAEIILAGFIDRYCFYSGAVIV